MSLTWHFKDQRPKQSLTLSQVNEFTKMSSKPQPADST